MFAACFSGNCEAVEAMLAFDPSLATDRNNLGAPAWTICMCAPNGRASLDIIRSRFPEEFPRWVEAERHTFFGQSLAAQTVSGDGHPETLIALIDELGLPTESTGPIRGMKSTLMVGAAQLAYRMQRHYSVSHYAVS